MIGMMYTSMNSSPKGAMNTSPTCRLPRLRVGARCWVTDGDAPAAVVMSSRPAWPTSVVFLFVRCMPRLASLRRADGNPLVHLETLLVAIRDHAQPPLIEYSGERTLACGVELRHEVGVGRSGPLEERRILPAARH